MALWAYVNLIVAIIQTVPWSSGLANDGWNLLEDIRSQCGGRDLYCVLTINARLAQGARLRDIDASLFDAPVG